MIRVNIPSRRSGATIIEVMFAIGVLLFGLVGIAVMIPAASKIARNSMDLDRGSAIAQAVAAEFEARDLADRSQWWTIDDTTSTGSFIATGVLTGPACIDPLFMSQPRNLVPVGTTVGLSQGAYEPITMGGHNSFRRRVFPYYVAEYNPLVDPVLPMSASPWPAMPRLPRVTVSTPGSTVGTVPPSLALSRLVESGDQIVFTSLDDESMPPTQVFRPGDSVPSGATAFPAARSDRSEYSWFATIQPRTGGYGTANVVVLRGRDRTFETPPTGTPPDLDEPRELAERVAYVSGPLPSSSAPLAIPTPLAAFRGGAGGTVTLIATNRVSSELETGGWVMLIREAGVGVQHAWYRIVHSDPDAMFIQVVDPVGGATRDVWARSVTLEGPDWDFGLGDGIVANDTQAVLVEGVVAVHEFPVRLRP